MAASESCSQSGSQLTIAPQESQTVRIRWDLSAAAAAQFALAGCSIPEHATSTPVPERDIAAAAAQIEGATVLDVDRFQPTVTIGKNCRLQPLTNTKVALSPALRIALEKAAAYSLAQQGVGLLVLKDGNIILRSFPQGVNETTPTDSYSMHKSVAALVFGQALRENLIKSIDDPVGNYIEEWKDDPRGAITLHQALTMSSGLKFGDRPVDFLELLLSTDINAVALRTPLADPPGTVFAYSNANSQVAGIALERALKRAGYSGYAEYLEKKIWCPIGNGAAKLWLDRDGGAPHYYSGLFTNIDDWARIGELVRNKGKAGGKQVVPAPWIEKMGQPSAVNPVYGIHIWRGSPWSAKRRYNQNNPLVVIHSAPYLADDVLFFDGFGGQRVYVVPSAGLTIVRTGHVNFDYDDAKIVNLVLAGLEYLSPARCERRCGTVSRTVSRQPIRDSE